MSRFRRSFIILLPLVLLFAATTAIVQADTPTPSPSPSPSPSPGPSPSPTASPTPTPAPLAFTPPAVDSASATIRNSAGQVLGTARLLQDANGVVQVTVDVTGLSAGEHGMHIHTIGKCEPADFTGAGGHFNPGGKKHGLNNPQGPHAGDLLALGVDASGAAHYGALTNRITVSAGAISVLDADGSALIIHASPDDQVTDPTGNSGGRIACGVIARAPALGSAVAASATAQVKNGSGQVIGTAQLTEDAQGVVQVKLDATGLPAGQHGIHIHTVGKCEPADFTGAGGHFNPAGKKHGLLNPDGPHAGDLPALTADAGGAVHYEATTDRVSISSGPLTLLDADGSALVIHANADDQSTDPTGNSGGRIACGVIQKVEALPKTGGAPVSSGNPIPWLPLLGALIACSGAFIWRAGMRRRA